MVGGTEEATEGVQNEKKGRRRFLFIAVYWLTGQSLVVGSSVFCFV